MTMTRRSRQAAAAVLVVAALLQAAAGTPVAPGQHKVTIKRPEGERTFYLWVPEAYVNGSAAVPLHVSFHGLGDTCLNYGHSTGLVQEAEAANFLYAYPCSEVGLLGRAWNSGVCCLDGVSGVDDVQFARAIVARVSADYRVDAGRVYASGFSNGAFMASVLGCQAPDVFVATASVSGVVEMVPGNEGGLRACDKAYAAFDQRVSTVNIHGTFDLVVPYTGDALLGFPPIPDDYRAWAARNGCAGNSTRTFKRGHYTGEAYSACTNGTEVALVTNAGGGHEWPIDGSFNTTSFIVQFFARHHR